MAAAARMYGSVVVPKRCVVHSTGHLRFSPLPSSRVLSLTGNSTLIASKMFWQIRQQCHRSSKAAREAYLMGSL